MTSRTPLVLVGDSQFAEIAYEYFTQDSSYEVKGFAVERAFITRETLFGLPVVALEELEQWFPPAHYAAFVAITFLELNRVRARIYRDLKARGYSMASYVSSRAFVWKNVTLGEHVFVFEDNTLQPFTQIGDNVVLWSGNHIGHHSRVEEDCFISSHVVISGNCNVGARSFLGVNATLAHGITLGADNFVGMNAIVAHSTEPDTVLMPPAFAEMRKISAKRYCKVREKNS